MLGQVDDQGRGPDGPMKQAGESPWRPPRWHSECIRRASGAESINSMTVSDGGPRQTAALVPVRSRALRWLRAFMPSISRAFNEHATLDGGSVNRWRQLRHRLMNDVRQKDWRRRTQDVQHTEQTDCFEELWLTVNLPNVVGLTLGGAYDVGLGLQGQVICCSGRLACSSNIG